MRPLRDYKRRRFARPAGLFPAPWVLATLGATLLFFFSGCARRETRVELGTRTHTLHVGNRAEPRDLDPALITAAADFTVVRALCEGLTDLDPKDCHPLPGVAERWEVSPDGLHWTFHLRASARWSTGEPVTATDFMYSYRRALSPAFGAEYGYLMSCLKNAEAFQAGTLTDFAQVGVKNPDEHTLLFDLREPTPFFPALVATPIWFPVHRATIEKFGRMDQRGTLWTRPGNFVGNGAFVLESWQEEKEIRVRKSPTYWDAARVQLETVVFYPIPASAVEEAAFRAGQLHVTQQDLPFEKALAYRNDPGRAALLQEYLTYTTEYYRLNCRVAPLNDVRVRRALSLALDRVKLANAVAHVQEPATSLVPPGGPGYTSDRNLPFDPVEARRLLSAAGFPGGKNFPALELLFFPGSRYGGVVCEAVQQMWRENLGIEVKLQQQELKIANDAVMHGHYQISRYNWTGDYLDPTSFLDLMLAEGGNNQTGWANAEYDGLLMKARQTLVPAERSDLLRRAENLLLSEVPILPLFYLPSAVLRSPDVSGWYSNFLDVHSLKYVSLAKSGTALVAPTPP